MKDIKRVHYVLSRHISCKILKFRTEENKSFVNIFFDFTGFNFSKVYFLQ